MKFTNKELEALRNAIDVWLQDYDTEESDLTIQRLRIRLRNAETKINKEIARMESLKR